MFNFKRPPVEDSSVESESSGLRRLIPSMRKLLLGGGITTIAGLGFNYYEASRFAEDRHEKMESSTGNSRIDATHVDVDLEECLAAIPDVMEKHLRALSSVDPLAAEVLDRGLSLRVIPGETWTHTNSILCVMLPGGEFALNGNALYSTLKQSYKIGNDKELSATGRAELSAFRFLPAMLGACKANECYNLAADHAASETVLGAAEFVNLVVCQEDNSRTLIRAGLSTEARAFANSLHIDAATILPGWPGLELGAASPETTYKRISEHWSLPSLNALRLGTASTQEICHAAILSGVLCEVAGHNAADPVLYLPAHDKEIEDILTWQVRELDRISTAVQRSCFEQGVTDIQFYLMNGAIRKDSRFYPESFYPRCDADRAILAAESLANLGNGYLDSQAELLLPQHKIVLDIVVTLFEQNIAQITTSQDGELRCARSFDAYTVRKLAPALESCLHFIPEPERARYLNRFELGVETLGLALRNEFEGEIEQDRYTILREMLPAAHDLMALSRTSSMVHKVEDLDKALKRWQSDQRADYSTPSLQDLLVGDKELVLKLCSALTPRERDWLALLCTNHVNYPDQTRYAERYVPESPQDYVESLSSSWFQNLELSAQVAICRELTGTLPDTPLISVIPLDPGYPQGTHPEGALRELDKLRELLAILTPEKSSLIIESYLAIPRPERDSFLDISSAEYSATARKLLMLTGTSNESGGRLRTVLPLIAKANPAYSTLDAAHILEVALPKACPNLFWASNVSTLSSATAEEISLNLIYAMKVQGELAPDRSLVDAHLEGSQDVRDFSLPLSRPAVWITHGVQWILDGSSGAPDGPGIFRQNPQHHISPFRTGAGPQHAVILWGANKFSDIFMDFEADAADWSRKLSRTYGTDCQVKPIGTEEELRGACLALLARAKAAGTLKEAALIITGHGSADEINSVRAFSSLRGAAAEQVASIGSLNEGDLKRIVNEVLAPHFTHVTVMTNACHSGAWVE